jgi:hypothetical protein
MQILSRRATSSFITPCILRAFRLPPPFEGSREHKPLKGNCQPQAGITNLEYLSTSQPVQPLSKSHQAMSPGSGMIDRLPDPCCSTVFDFEDEMRLREGDDGQTIKAHLPILPSLWRLSQHLAMKHMALRHMIQRRIISRLVLLL